MSNKQPITEISISGFKSILDLEHFSIRDLNVLIGANGAGKSNFISFFIMLNEIINRRLQLWTQKQGLAERIFSFGLDSTNKLKALINLGPISYEFQLEPTLNGSLVFSSEQLIYGRMKHPRHIELGQGHTESNLKNIAQTAAGDSIEAYCYNSITSWKVYHFHDTSETAGMRRIGSVHDNAYLRPDASNLAAFLYRLRHEQPRIYGQILKTVRLAIPFFDDFIFAPRTLPTEEQQINLQWCQRDSDYPLWPSQLSDGSLRFICLVTALLQPDPPSTIIIDEPELGLHPYALPVLGALIRSASTRMQVIIATQSVILVNQFTIDDMIIVERQDGVSTFKRLDEQDFQVWLEDYAAGELWEKNLLGGTPRS